jgi:hypothetical protein
MSDFLDDCSPFDAGIGKFANVVQIPLGEGRGFLKVWNTGTAELYDEFGGELFTFTPADAGILRALADELESMAEVYAETERTGASGDRGVITASGPRREPEATEQPAKKPVEIVAGVTPELQAFALR